MIAKRCGSLLLCAGLLLGTVPVSYAADVQQEAVQTAEIKAKGICGENLRWTLYTDGTMIINGTGKMEESSTQPWDYYLKDIKKVEICEGATSIARGAFINCVNLQEISIPNSVKSVGGGAFYYSGLTGSDADWENGICYVDGWVAMVKYYVVDCVLRDGTRGISDSVFEHRTDLKTVIIPEGVVSIGKAAFDECVNLTKVTIPTTVTEFGSSIFVYCESLSEVNLPDNMTKIPRGMFAECTSLREIEIPSSVQTIERGAFSVSGLMKVDIPEGVTKIEYGAFAATKLTEISLPSTLKMIDIRVFENCNALKSVYYYGTEAMLDQIEIGEYNNDALFNADIYIMMPFEDVPMSEYYAEPVMWAAANEITSGVDETHFAPNKVCTRAEIVRFLWNAAGKPTVNSKNPFTDVKKSDWYYQAVRWAVSEGITTGMDAKHFAPNETCTRAEAMTFLWRAEGKPLADTINPFADVQTTDWFYNAVRWAVSEDITTGMSATEFASQNACTRAHVVTFLYRYLAEEA